MSEPGSPEQLIEERIARDVDEMIELSMLALDPEQRPLVERQWRGIAQILLRAQLILGILAGDDVEIFRRLIVQAMDMKPPGLRLVKNG